MVSGVSTVSGPCKPGYLWWKGRVNPVSKQVGARRERCAGSSQQPFRVFRSHNLLAAPGTWPHSYRVYGSQSRDPGAASGYGNVLLRTGKMIAEDLRSFVGCGVEVTDGEADRQGRDGGTDANLLHYRRSQR